jgi:hypothetical protein
MDYVIIFDVLKNPKKLMFGGLVLARLVVKGRAKKMVNHPTHFVLF